MRMRSVLGGIVAAVTISAAAEAAIVVDQNQPLSTHPLAGVSPTSHPVQSFQTSAGNIAGGGFYLYSIGGPDPVTFEIGVWTKLPNAPGTIQLASNTTTLTDLEAGDGSVNASWVDVFWSPINLLADTTYYLSIDVTHGGGGGVGGVFRGDPYPQGEEFLRDGGLLIYQTYASDLAFRTYAFAEDPTGAIPEPATWALLILGFGGAGAMLRRLRSPAPAA